ncbi:MAG TPA: hypothetical protein VD651_01795 [Nitrosarchaeum sp.]|nr:hypothetical protein [Nitrosarchaeum sp.]
MDSDSLWAIQIRSKDLNNLLDLIFNEHLDVSCGGPSRSDDGFFETVAYVTEKKKNELSNRRSASMEIIELEDMFKTGIERQKEVSKENRFSRSRASRSTYQGLGIKE